MIIEAPGILKHNILMKLASRLGLITNELGDGSVCSTRRNFPCEGNYPHPNQQVSEKVNQSSKLLSALDQNSTQQDILELTVPTWDLGTTQEQAGEVLLPMIFGDPDRQRKLHALCLEFSDIWATHLLLM